MMGCRERFLLELLPNGEGESSGYSINRSVAIAWSAPVKVG